MKARRRRKIMLDVGFWMLDPDGIPMESGQVGTKKYGVAARPILNPDVHSRCKIGTGGTKKFWVVRIPRVLWGIRLSWKL